MSNEHIFFNYYVYMFSICSVMNYIYYKVSQKQKGGHVGTAQVPC